MYKKYEQIKPNMDNMDREQVMELYARIKDWQIDWKEVEDKYKQIEKDIQHFGMKMPDFYTYNNIKQKLQK